MDTIEIKGSGGVAHVVSPASTISVSTGTFTGTISYDGEYEVTPLEETQILHTAQRLLAEDITIHPIPSNYGRIEYDGAKLIIS